MLTLDLPDLPLKHEQGEITMDGTHFINKDIYWGETLHWDHLTPLMADPNQKPAPTPTFRSSRPA